MGRRDEARLLLARFEGWLKVQKSDTWQQQARLRLLHEEARGLILAMPKVAE
jgi:hypothetical protein